LPLPDDDHSVDLARLLLPLVPPLCWECGAPAPNGEPLCRACRRTLRWLPPDVVELEGVSAWAPVAYEGPARALVKALKFRGAAGVAEAMGAQIAAGAPDSLLAGAALVPVPLHRARLRRRGFNQAARLAAAVGARAALPSVDCLVRTGGARTQMGRPRGARVAALDGAIAVRPSVTPPRRALLVDDVITTGATLAACARALRTAGSADVAAIAYARTPTR
jgi:ComF family protein